MSSFYYFKANFDKLDSLSVHLATNIIELTTKKHRYFLIKHTKDDKTIFDFVYAASFHESEENGIFRTEKEAKSGRNNSDAEFDVYLYPIDAIPAKYVYHRTQNLETKKLNLLYKVGNFDIISDRKCECIKLPEQLKKYQDQLERNLLAIFKGKNGCVECKKAETRIHKLKSSIFDMLNVLASAEDSCETDQGKKNIYGRKQGIHSAYSRYSSRSEEDLEFFNTYVFENDTTKKEFIKTVDMPFSVQKETKFFYTENFELTNIYFNINSLLRAYALLHHNNLEYSIILHGNIGNGKRTFASALRLLMPSLQIQVYERSEYTKIGMDSQAIQDFVSNATGLNILIIHSDIGINFARLSKNFSVKFDLPDDKKILKIISANKNLGNITVKKLKGLNLYEIENLLSEIDVFAQELSHDSDEEHDSKCKKDEAAPNSFSEISVHMSDLSVNDEESNIVDKTSGGSVKVDVVQMNQNIADKYEIFESKIREKYDTNNYNIISKIMRESFGEFFISKNKSGSNCESTALTTGSDKKNGLQNSNKITLSSHASKEDLLSSFLTKTNRKSPQVCETTLDDISGYEETKKILTNALLRPKPNLIQYPKGILLSGPPGCSKTMFAKALSNYKDYNFLSLNASNIKSKWVGDSEKNLVELFQKAEELAPSILFIDEIDSISTNRNSLSNLHDVSLLNTLLFLMDGIKTHNTIIIGATNRKDVIDPALLRPGRFDKHIEVNLPDENDRRDILTKYLKKSYCGEPAGCDFCQLQTNGETCKVDIEKLVKATCGMSGAEIAAAVNEGKQYFVSDLNDENSNTCPVKDLTSYFERGIELVSGFRVKSNNQKAEDKTADYGTKECFY